jgi:hypothetical protein
MANLASTYRNQGRWKEAEVLDVQVVETSIEGAGAGTPFHAHQHEQSCFNLENRKAEMKGDRFDEASREATKRDTRPQLLPSQ